ncbi:MAG: HAD family hydrolase [Oscillospiraceae bacterium]|nr:HAD family hydrolase [Oscillospiraceae bacterium]MDE7170845.1 HAD family hydrolase [Oscillospiraceae bacterium]
MERKLIFLDIDGTLTEPGHNVPPDSAVEAVRRARQSGHRVVLASGRSYGMLSPLLRYGFDGLVGSAGGYIMYGEEVVYDCPMTPAQQELVLDVFQRNGVFRTVEGRDTSYTDEAFKDFLREAAQAEGNSELLRWREQIENELGIRPMAEYRGEPVYKVGFVSRDAADLREPMRVLGDSFDFCIQGTDQFGAINGELINKAFNKGLAVERLCGYLNIPIDDTIAFGDSMNDLEMIQTAGLGVCMGNGSEALKKIADEVCPPVGEDGLYQAFERHGLI